MTFKRGMRRTPRNSGAGNYRNSGRRSLIRGTFSALVRIAGLSFVLVLSMGFIVLISIALLFGYNTAMNSDFFALNKIEISGNRQLTYDELTRLMNVQPGDNILQFRVSDLQARLSSNPWFEEVSVKRVFPDKLVVNCTEKQAYFWIQEQNRLYYADKKGKMITEVSPGRYISLPVLQLKGDERDHDLDSLVAFLENRSFPFSLREVSWIRADGTGSVEIHIDSRNIDISLDRDQLRSGPGRLSRVWSDLGTRQEIDTVEKITLSGRNAWVAYLRDELQ